MSFPHTDPEHSLLSQDLFSVKGHVIVITGGGTGLGKYMASGYYVNQANVYIVGRRMEVLEQAVEDIHTEYGKGDGFGTVHPIQGDVSTKAGAKAIADKLKHYTDHVDVLVNNAAVQRGWREPIENAEGHNDQTAARVERLLWEGVEDDDFTFTNTVNINGTYFMTAALVPLLKSSEIKSVIVISSIAATANQRATSSLTYGVSKAGTSHLATMLAGRLAPLKIRVNTIAPGTFASELTTTRSSDGTTSLLPGAGKACMRTPLERAGYKHEIFGPALLLASRAGGFMDNAVLAVDGGRNMVAGINDGVPQPSEAF